ncbi:hypothetical protein M1N55_06530 [Dehalococcoidia bacterium]|nr:hypothetical protein [Dehalococcoidia bacterium]
MNKILSKSEILILCLSELIEKNGSEKIDREDLYITMWEKDKNRFSWKKYPYPNRHILEQSEHVAVNQRSWVRRHLKSDFRSLTQRGYEQVSKLKKDKNITFKPKQNIKTDNERMTKLFNRLVKSDKYTNWIKLKQKKGAWQNKYEAAHMLNIPPHLPDRSFSEYITELVHTAKNNDLKQVENFLCQSIENIKKQNI